MISCCTSYFPSIFSFGLFLRAWNRLHHLGSSSFRRIHSKRKRSMIFVEALLNLAGTPVGCQWQGKLTKKEGPWEKVRPWTESEFHLVTFAVWRLYYKAQMFGDKIVVELLIRKMIFHYICWDLDRRGTALIKFSQWIPNMIIWRE